MATFMTTRQLKQEREASDELFIVGMAGGEQTQKSKGGGEGEGDGEQGEGGTQLKEKGEELKEEMDNLLDEIDSVLEENAEEFVKNYVQRGGE